jgi:hypothetical protein
MGFVNFLKRTAKKIGSGISAGAKFVATHARPVLNTVAKVVEKVAPYASGIAGALGQPELAGPITMAGKIASGVRGLTESKQSKG